MTKQGKRNPQKQDYGVTREPHKTNPRTGLTGKGDVSLEQSLARELHLKQVLLSIRSFNQLLLKATDSVSLIEKACQRLGRSMGYHSVWIGLHDQKANRLSPVVGSDESFPEFVAFREMLSQGEYPEFVQRVLGTSDLLVLEQPVKVCNEWAGVGRRNAACFSRH